MGISKTNLGISIDSIKNFVKTIAGTHNSIPGRDVNDSHPISAITGLQDKVDIMDDISVAQKTVNNNLDYFYGRPNTTITPILNQNINFVRRDGNMISTNGKLSLKPGRSYEFTVILAYVEINTYALIQYKLMAGNVEIALFTPYRGNAQYEYPYTCNCTYTNNTNENVDFEIIVSSINTTDKILDTLSSLTVKEIAHSVAIDPVEYVNTNTGIEDSPVGHILSLMGKTTPKHYLTCDGSIYNITDYPYLSQYIKEQFGIFNFFGGDGTATFAVPDLRDEFLRGYHGTKTEPLSGEIGVHQKSTEHINFMTDASSKIYMDGEYGKYLAVQNTDSLIKSTVSRGWTTSSPSNWAGTTGNKFYTSRPTNVAVLYCIKYEPTYFMSIQGLMEETSLWEGIKILPCSTNVITINSVMTLTNNLFNYDKIEFQYSIYNSTNGANWLNKQDTFHTKNLNIDTTGYEQILLDAGSTAYNFMALVDVTSTNTLNFRLTKANNFSATSADSIRLTKVVGIKYKTFQN